MKRLMEFVEVEEVYNEDEYLNERREDEKK